MSFYKEEGGLGARAEDTRPRAAMAGYRIAWEALDDGFQHTWHVCLSCESTGGLQLPLLSVLMASRVLRAPFSGVRHRLSRCCSLCRGKGSRW